MEKFGHKFEAYEKLYEVENESLIYTKEGTEEYYIHKTTTDIQSKDLQEITDTLAYLKFLSKACPYFAEPITLCTSKDNNKLHVEQLFNKYTTYKPEYFTTYKAEYLNSFIVQSLKALTLVKRPGYIIHPLITSYYSEKRHWVIYLLKTKYKSLNTIHCWILSLAYMILQSKYEEFIKDIEILGKSDERRKVANKLPKDPKIIKEISNEWLKDSKHDGKDFIAFVEYVCEKANIKDFNRSSEPIKDITERLRKDFKFNNSTHDEKCKKELFESKDILKILLDLNKWTTDNIDRVVMAKNLEYLSFGNQFINS